MTKMKSEMLIYLISTMSPRANGIIIRLPEPRSDVEYLICCQIIGDEEVDSRLFERTDVKLLIMSGLGLTKSRNYLLKKFFENYTDSYAVITDDDVGFLEVSYSVIKSIALSKQADVVTGRVLTPDGYYFKSYKEEPFVHTSRTSNVVSSIEMVLSSELSKSNILFDERFGLGSTYKMGEEAIFIGDLIKCEYKVVFYPINLFIHPEESTGSRIDKSWFQAKAAFYARKYGKFLGAALLLRRLMRMMLFRRASFVDVLTSLTCFIRFK
jgi:hypothetical protein